MVLFTGIQATGKSEYYLRNFYKTHIRINLDMLKTRNRERILIDACLEAKQPFVVDNTNLTAAGRKLYIDKAKGCGFEIVGYYFQSAIGRAIERNELRSGKEKLPLAAIRSAHAKLEAPTADEGYDRLYYVRIENNEFIVEGFKYDL